jgi:hypothetical protein
MAQMPRGEPRRVPDPAGEAFDAMIREGRRQEQDAKSFPAFSPYGRVDAVRNAPRKSSTIMIGPQMYQAVDNGRATKLVPIDPLYTPAERAAQRDGVVRALFMAGHTFGTMAYGGATMAGAPQRTRDAALLAGGMIDEAASGSASRARVVRPKPNSPQQPLSLTRPRIALREPNAEGQAAGGAATVISNVLGTGTKASRRIKPVGHVSGLAPWNHDRSHLIAAWFGGSGRDRANLMTLERDANQTRMKGFERDVARRARGGETVEYSVTPLYAKGSLPPSMVLMTAFGYREGPKARLIRNPAGRPR